MLLTACTSSVRFSGKNNDKEAKREYSKLEIHDQTYLDDATNLNDIQSKIIMEAEKWIGTPYCYGGSLPGCTDCSGFVKSVYESIGISLPRTAAEQYSGSKIIDESYLEPGDLVFFGEKSRIRHVGIYIGNSQLIHASSSVGVVRQSLNETYMRQRLAGFGRVF
jgi:cell wall-associated NlpC family hydrolase